jgi:hypothetical protein
MIVFPTSPAVLRAGQLEWEAGGPPDAPVRVHVTVLAPLSPSPVSGPAMSLGDALVAATALVFGRGLLTRNIKDFFVDEAMLCGRPSDLPRRMSDARAVRAQAGFRV